MLLGQFDSDSDPFLSLPGYLAFKDIAVVTEGLINLDVTKCASEFVTTFMKRDNEEEQLQAIEFESEIVNGQVITKQDKSRSFTFTAAEYAKYLDHWEVILKMASSLIAILDDPVDEYKTLVPLLQMMKQHAKAEWAYYLTDYDLLLSPSLEKAFEDGLHDVTKKMLPFYDWRLSHMVSHFFVLIP